VNDRAALAIQHPCHRAIETTHPRFTAMMRPWYSIVTVNK